ncbi:KUP/HAK/KT family potassium transporter [Streptococcus parasuis]|uniref:KUP/HAK/KT family potassium transporter n=1 Tax=Streptococcus parasuis TaxID=1501662 RepID=UPI0028AB11FF|nr:KUP/HAK/KT family potassium transporter [Streptococcus parasuis]
MTRKDSLSFERGSKAGFLIALGVVYGDIGTSPLYTMQALVRGQGGIGAVNKEFILGSISLIIWTLTIITTIKYVLIALKADNDHEGGIFSLYTLVRKRAKWLIIPAMIGGSTLLADGALTPAVTVTSAIEGLRSVPLLETFYQDESIVIATSLAILTVLFSIQRFGTGFVGKVFGPVMFIWFLFLGLVGLTNTITYPEVFKAINPLYAISLLMSPENKEGIFILGSVFLATTGAEALYSDLGHVGRGNIYVSWPFVKVSILLSYFGQGAWILSHQAEAITLNPFFASVPQGLSMIAVILATLAAIIASQALISGSFTLVSEAMRLKLFPRLRITYPGASLGQLYIPRLNWLLWMMTSTIVLYFRSAEKMEAAYGLAITVTMLMTSILLTEFVRQSGIKPWQAYLGLAFFLSIEGMFFLSSVIKFVHGGYVVVIISLFILLVMFVWHKSNQILSHYTKWLPLSKYMGQLQALSQDKSVPLYASNLVYLSRHLQGHFINHSILYSILEKKPKRANQYWFVRVHVTDQPYTKEYSVDTLDTIFLIKVDLYLGFRMRQDVSRYLRTIVGDLMKQGRIPKQKQLYSLQDEKEIGDFRFVIIEETMANSPELNTFDRFILGMKAFIKSYTASPARWFGLQFSEVTVERIPIILSDVRPLPIDERKQKVL